MLYKFSARLTYVKPEPTLASTASIALRQGSIFDYYVDENAVEWVHWDKRVPNFHYVPDQFASLFVPTAETTRLAFLANLLINNQHRVMFIGNTGKHTLQWSCAIILEMRCSVFEF